MLFESAPPSIIRSVKQRDLLNTWLRLRSGFDALPAVAAYHPDRLEDELKDIVYYVVSESELGWRFVIDSTGSRLSHAYGKAGKNNVGTELRDYIGPRMIHLVLPIYEECARRALPTYSISMSNDINGRSVAYERLLMPFSSGGGITHIIASLKTISEDGKFEIIDLLRDPDQLPVYRLRAVVDRELSLSQSPRLVKERDTGLAGPSTSDVVEI